MLEAELASAVAIAQKAGQILLEVYATDFGVSWKAHSDPVTVADEQANAHIVAALRQQFPDDGIIAEESPDHETALAKRRIWYVDPLDGTKEFIARNGEFTVNVALVRDHRPVLGVVAAPVLGITYYAAEGLGAFRAEGRHAPVPIAVRKAADPLVVVGSRSHRGDSLDDVLARLGPHELRPMGSALKFCLVAEGAADFYPRLGPTSEWDTAAAQAVLEIAGGAVTTLDGNPLRYNQRDTLLNGDFIALGDARLPWRHWQPETAA